MSSFFPLSFRLRLFKGSSQIPDTPFVLLVTLLTALFVLGLTTVFSATSAEIFEQNLGKDVTQAILRQSAYLIFGIAWAAVTWWIGFWRLYRVSTQLFVVGTLLLLLTLVPGIGREVNGSRRWLVLAGISIQPSELMKGILPLFFIAQAILLQQKGYPFWKVFSLALFSLLPVVLVLLQPNNGTAAVLGMALLVLCWMLRVPLKYWALPVALIVLFGGACALRLPYVTARLKVYWNPESDLLGKGHQPYQAKIAAGSGGLWGKGPGNSWQKLSFLPEAQNDYIAAIYAEEFGYAGMIGLISLYALCLFVAVLLLFRVREKPPFYFCATFLFLFFLQAFLNLGVVAGLLPSTGLNLPLFSQGGSSLMANCIGWGIFFHCTKTIPDCGTLGT